MKGIFIRAPALQAVRLVWVPRTSRSATVEWNQSSLRPVWDRVAARELYDHRNESTFPTDFDAGETENVAARGEFAGEVAALSALVRRQFG